MMLSLLVPSDYTHLCILGIDFTLLLFSLLNIPLFSQKQRLGVEGSCREGRDMRQSIIKSKPHLPYLARELCVCAGGPEDEPVSHVLLVVWEPRSQLRSHCGAGALWGRESYSGCSEPCRKMAELSPTPIQATKAHWSRACNLP